MADELVPTHEAPVDLLTEREQTLAQALEDALNLCREYQRLLAIADIPDPNFVKARQMLTKWGMTYYKPSKSARVFVDGEDITEHPDSIDSDAEVVEEVYLTAEEYYGTETAELVQDTEGHMHLKKSDD